MGSQSPITARQAARVDAWTNFQAELLHWSQGLPEAILSKKAPTPRSYQEEFSGEAWVPAALRKGMWPTLDAMAAIFGLSIHFGVPKAQLRGCQTSTGECTVCQVLLDGKAEMLLPMALETSLSRPLLEGYGLVLAYDASTASMSSEAGKINLQIQQLCGAAILDSPKTGTSIMLTDRGLWGLHFLDDQPEGGKTAGVRPTGLAGEAEGVEGKVLLGPIIGYGGGTTVRQAWLGDQPAAFKQADSRQDEPAIGHIQHEISIMRSAAMQPLQVDL
ncbi:hypothetical protein WJX84_008565 [Apatococcus fuscideae]|uniref:Uncharacterized protein n=1 Tax=Apatococcus fuscideae TaxID=2026836 RepID=A0AAW1T3C7_9CHLO